MKAIIKPMHLEVEITRLPYRNQENPLREDLNFVVEATDGRIFTVSRESDLIIEHESYAEKVKAEAEREEYYSRCRRYRWHWLNISEKFDISATEFFKRFPFDRIK